MVFAAATGVEPVKLRGIVDQDHLARRRVRVPGIEQAKYRDIIDLGEWRDLRRRMSGNRLSVGPVAAPQHVVARGIDQRLRERGGVLVIGELRDAVRRGKLHVDFARMCEVHDRAETL
jgi:hypothetical protein